MLVGNYYDLFGILVRYFKIHYIISACSVVISFLMYNTRKGAVALEVSDRSYFNSSPLLSTTTIYIA
jgi:hypothetical protein